MQTSHASIFAAPLLVPTMAQHERNWSLTSSLVRVVRSMFKVMDNVVIRVVGSFTNCLVLPRCLIGVVPLSPVAFSRKLHPTTPLDTKPNRPLQPTEAHAAPPGSTRVRDLSLASHLASHLQEMGNGWGRGYKRRTPQNLTKQ